MQGSIGMSILSRMRLSAQIFAIGLIAAIGFAAILGEAFWSANRQTEFDGLARNGNAIALNAAKLGNSLLQLRRNEKDFLLRSDSQYAESHQKNAQVAIAQIAELTQLAKQSGDPQLLSRIQAIQPLLDVYLAGFHDLVALRLEMGLTPETGLEGQMRNTVHDLEAKFAEVKDYELGNLLLMLRRHEKDFMLRRQESYRKEHAKVADTLKDRITQRDLPLMEKIGLKASIDAYEGNFQSWAITALKLAEVQKGVSEKYAQLEPIVIAATDRANAVSKASSDASAEQSEINLKIAIGLIGLALSASLMVSTIVWMFMKRSLGNIEGVMRDMAAGDLSVEIKGTEFRNEIGAMARSVEVFKENAIERQRLEADAAANAAVAEAERERAAAERARVAAEQAEVVRLLGESLRTLAAGDLTTHLDGEFSEAYAQIRHDFNEATARLKDAIIAVVNSTNTIKNGSEEIADASQDLSSRTTAQAASLEETAAALNEITETVRQSNEHTLRAKQIAANADAEATAGGAVVRQAVEAMDAISTSSQQISEIITVMDQIAFQTNLLALNAGVEAARAGDAGRGFAVVASEVRALAQRSSEASKDIKALIQTSTEHVDTGVRLVGETGKALDRIQGSVSEINTIINELANAAKEQAQGLAEINNAIHQMDDVTQKNVAMVEESSAASHTLSEETRVLSDLVAQFRLTQEEAAIRKTSHRSAA